jgi:hypothetical protein
VPWRSWTRIARTSLNGPREPPRDDFWKTTEGIQLSGAITAQTDLTANNAWHNREF